MVVDHHHVEADLLGAGQGLVGRRAAVDRDHQFDTRLADAAERGRRRAIALGQAIGDIDGQFLALGAKPPDQLRGAGGAIDVIVSEDRHRAVGDQGVDKNLGGQIHVYETRRIGKQRLEGWVEVVGAVISADAA